MSRLGLSTEEQTVLRSWLLIAVDSPCLAEWEFESLVGRSRTEARRWIEADVPGAEYDEHLLDQIVTMLSVLAGSLFASDTLLDGPVIAKGAIEQMLEKLFWSTDDLRANRGDQQSSVTLRPSVQADLTPASVRKPARKRRAASR